MRYNKDNKLRVATLCSGYDAQCLALERLKRDYPEFDYELVAWAEFDPESKAPLEKQPAVISHNALFPQWKDRNWGDMTKIDWSKFPETDLLFYSTPCFVAGTLVLTADGYKPIEEVKVGDMVLTHKNRYQKVLRTGYKESFTLEEIKGNTFNTIICTENHPFYIRRKKGDSFSEPEWLAAELLTKETYIGIPKTIYDSKDINAEGAFILDNIMWCPLKSRKSLLGEWAVVYNLEVEEDNSYTANGAIVHNCQSISQAGLQHGFKEGSGTRSSIIWNVRDAVKALKPKYLCLENVAAMVSGKFVGLFNLWQSELQKLGYVNFAQILNAKDYGVPQNRERIFLVSIRIDDKTPQFFFPESFPLEKRLKDVLEKNVDESYYLDDTRIKGVFESNFTQEKRRLQEKDTCDTLLSRDWKDPKLVKDNTPKFFFPELIPLEKRLGDVLEDNVDESYYLSDARLEGVTKSTKKEQEKGNGFAFKPKDRSDIANSLTTLCGGGRKTDNYLIDAYPVGRERTEEEKQRRREFGDKGAKFASKQMKILEDGVSTCITTFAQKDNLCAELYNEVKTEDSEQR